MEGGTDHDLRILDSSNNVNDETKSKLEASTSDDAIVSDASMGKSFVIVILLIECFL
jgi:hypothetical protein